MTKKIGVVANCNRGYHAASGTWIKISQEMMPYIQMQQKELVGFAQLYPEAKIVHSRMKFFHNDLSENSVIKKGKRISRILKTNKNPNPHKQYSLLCIINEIGTPTTFIQKTYSLNQVDTMNPSPCVRTGLCGLKLPLTAIPCISLMNILQNTEFLHPQ